LILGKRSTLQGAENDMQGPVSVPFSSAQWHNYATEGKMGKISKSHKEKYKIVY
jgi:hypothetical protein